MGNKLSKKPVKIENNCDLYLNNELELKPYDYKTNNGYYYIYFNTKKINKDKNYLEFSYLNPDNTIEKDIISCDLYLDKFSNIQIKKDKYREYSLFSDKKRSIKIRIGKTNQIVYILPISDSYNKK